MVGNFIDMLAVFLALCALVALAVGVVFVICLSSEMSINKKGTEGKLVEDIETHEGHDYAYCPHCGEYLSHLWNSKNCGDCGQPVRWK